MKNRIIPLLIIISLIFLFVVFYKGLNKSSLYAPNNGIKKDVPIFSASTFFDKKEISSKNIFDKDKFYLMNIWASWCVPCRDEHSLLLSLSHNKKIEIIGLNYKDNSKNAKKFLEELGNPYKMILLDKDGTKSIEWGAFGVPETFLIYKNKILKKFVGPLNTESLKTIERILK
tara:strand:+ start:1842 stop:2360 length:519 start_codon:yes stop_codon:yes gene_type:complete